MEQQTQTERAGPASERRLVIPGEVLAEGPRVRPGPGTYAKDGKLLAARLGLAEERQGQWAIIPLSGVYVPRPGDSVIAIITEVGPSNWMTDINAPYPAPMHSSETPWKIDFGETSLYLKAGDTVLAKILFVDETKKTQITMRDPSLKKLEGGHVIEIQPTKVARVIGRQGSMVQLITRYTDVWMVVGQNGRVWLNGETSAIQVAVDTIRLIEDQAHRSGLTEIVTRFLKERTGKNLPEAGPPGRGGPQEER